MSDYAIGDVQGCYDALQRLLDCIKFNDRNDRLWFVGDLVNRGPASLAVLRFIRKLPIPARICLGNHDLHLIAQIFAERSIKNADDSLDAILKASDKEELGHWLRKQSMLCEESSLNILVCHAGIAPCWDLEEARKHAKELEQVLAGDNYSVFLKEMYGNEPNYWCDALDGMARLRVITNYFTRMRFCDRLGRLELKFKGSLAEAPANLFPWFSVPDRKTISAEIVFGHWAALNGYSPNSKIHSIDTGCLWGGRLTALRLQDRKRYSVPGLSS